MQFVIIHGAFGDPEENWIPQLKEGLIALGQEVLVPTFPCDSWDDITNGGKNGKSIYQDLDNWLNIFEEKYLPIIKDKKICFIGHSLSPVFILHIVNKFELDVDSAIFVSPFLRELEREDLWQFDLANKSFYKTDFDFEKLQKLIPESYVLYSESDPYVRTELFREFGNLMNSSMIRVKKAGHLNASANLNEFPLIFELCKSRMDLNLYQKYVAHRRDLYGVDYIKPTEEVIYLKPAEFFDEGIFKFRNLQSHGFCTLFTSMKIWDTQSVYMKACRLAAKRMGDMTRVFVVDDIKDLARPELRKQLELDIESSVKVYFVMKEDVESITDTLDFGVWDNEYLCIVNNNEDEGTLSSRKIDIAKGREWEIEILKKSTRIQSIENDLNDFLKDHS